MQSVTRRQFLRNSALGAVVISQASAALEAATPDTKLRLGLIGCGWYGMEDAKAALKSGGVEITCICDVDSDHLSQSAESLEKLQGKRPATLKMYEDLLQRSDLDAVIIATPPHWHALQLLATLKRGLD